MNSFASWNPQRVAEHNARVAGRKPLSKTILAALEEKYATEKVSTSLVTALPKKKKPLLNKTETQFFAELQRRGHKTILCQAIMLRLGDGCQYRPDFVVVTNGLDNTVLLTCYETKAPHRFATAGVTKLKCAAAAYPWMRFFLITRDKKTWTEKEIGK